MPVKESVSSQSVERQELIAVVSTSMPRFQPGETPSPGIVRTEVSLAVTEGLRRLTELKGSKATRESCRIGESGADREAVMANSLEADVAEVASDDVAAEAEELLAEEGQKCLRSAISRVEAMQCEGAELAQEVLTEAEQEHWIAAPPVPSGWLPLFGGGFCQREEGGSLRYSASGDDRLATRSALFAAVTGALTAPAEALTELERAILAGDFRRTQLNTVMRGSEVADVPGVYEKASSGGVRAKGRRRR